MATDGPRARHVVLFGLDGLLTTSLQLPQADLLAQLGEPGTTGPAVPDAAGSCAPEWAKLLRAGGAADGEHGFDEVAKALPALELGAFIAEPTLEAVIKPTNPATVSKSAAVDVPGLQPWPRTLLGVEQIRDAAVTEVYEATEPSLTVVQANLMASAAADPSLQGLAADGADDLIDFVYQAFDGRRDRAQEDWLVVVVGLCAPSGDPVVLVEGDGLQGSVDLGTVEPAAVMSMVAKYLGVDLGGAWPEPPEGVLADANVKNGKVTS